MTGHERRLVFVARIMATVFFLLFYSGWYLGIWRSSVAPAGKLMLSALVVAVEALCILFVWLVYRPSPGAGGSRR